MTISVPENCALFPYQVAGVEAMAKLTSIGLFDDPGLGKTAQTICYSNTHPLIHRILVVCPATLKLNWSREFATWDTKGLSVQIVRAGKKIAITENVVIINYDMLGKYRDDLRAVYWDLMVLDECHALKNPKSARSREVLGRPAANNRPFLPALQARVKILLSGTPMVNKPIELWPLLSILDPKGLGRSWLHFVNRYCGARRVQIPGPCSVDPATGQVVQAAGRSFFFTDGATNLEELQDRMRQAFMIRRLKSEVLKDLPGKLRRVMPLEVDARSQKLIKKEMQLYEDYAKNMPGDFEIPEFSEIAAVRQEVASAKLPMAIQYVKEVLNEAQKVVVFAAHLAVVDSLRDAFREFGMVGMDSRTSVDDRQAAVDQFQNNPGVRVFVGTSKTAGVGITLTAASQVIFVESDWVPGVLTQAEDRLHRIGQKDTVLITHLVLEGSLDQHILETIIKKQVVLDRALNPADTGIVSSRSFLLS